MSSSRVARLSAFVPRRILYPVILTSWGSSQVWVRLSWLTLEALSPVGQPVVASLVWWR